MNNPSFIGTVFGITKSVVGLGSCDNTSDVNTPINIATQSSMSNLQNLTNTLNNKPYFGARICSNGTTSIHVGSIGMSSIVQSPTGVYTITFDSPHPNTNKYIIMATMSGSSGAARYITCVNTSSSQIAVYTYHTRTVETSYAFNFISIP